MRERARDLQGLLTARWRRLRAVLTARRDVIVCYGLRAGAVAVMLAVGLGYLLLGSQWTRVEEVRVHVLDPAAPSTGAALTDGTVPARRVQILRAAAVPLGEPLVEVHTEGIARQVDGLGRYSRVRVDRDWPDAVSITVTPRVPVLAAIGAGPGLRLIDAEGLAYEPVDVAPPGVVSARLAGEPAAAARSAVTAVLAFPPARRAQIQVVDVTADGAVTVQFDTVRVRWGGTGQDALKAAVVEALLARPGISGIDVSIPSQPITTD